MCYSVYYSCILSFPFATAASWTSGKWEHLKDILTIFVVIWMLIYECTRFIIYVWREQKCFNRYMRQRSSTMRWREVSTDCQSEVKAHTCGITRFTTSMWWNLHCLVKMPCSHIKSQLDNTIFHRGIFNGIDEKLKHGPPGPCIIKVC